MPAVTYHSIVCDGGKIEGDPYSGCQEESTFEPTASECRATALREGWHFRRLGGERWFCTDHEDEWRANAPKER